MGRLYDEILRVDRIIESRRLPVFLTKGKIAVRAGFPLGTITRDTPDDELRLTRLRAAIDAVLKDPGEDAPADRRGTSGARR